MKKLFIPLILIISILICPFNVSAAFNDAAKWSPCFTGERAYKTPKQSVSAVSGGIKFTGVGGERENYTYSLSEAIHFPSEDLTFEFSINEGTEPEMLYSFAFMDKPNWGSWYSNNDSSGFIINVRPYDSVEFNLAQALSWPTNIEIAWPEYDENKPDTTTSIKNKKMKFEIKKSATGYKLFVNGTEIPEFEEKSSQFFLPDVLPEGKAYLSVSGLNFTFDTELVSTMTLHNLSTAPSSFGNSKSTVNSAASSSGTSAPKIDNGKESFGESQQSEANFTSTISGIEESSSDSTLSESTPGKNSNLVIILVICIAVVLLGGLSAFYFLVLKKKIKKP